MISLFDDTWTKIGEIVFELRYMQFCGFTGENQQAAVSL